jgi:hypothetical protein
MQQRYKQFQSSQSSSSGSLFWARVKREERLANGTGQTDTIAHALDTIGMWASNYQDEQGQRNDQILSEGVYLHEDNLEEVVE